MGEKSDTILLYKTEMRTRLRSAAGPELMKALIAIWDMEMGCNCSGSMT